MLTVYGIKNCATMKKTFDFMANHQIDYEFFDYKKQVLSLDTFLGFVATFGIEKVINKKGTTYKKFDDTQKSIIDSGDNTAIYELIKNHQSVIKRPIVQGGHDGKTIDLIGFDEVQYVEVLK